MTKELERVGVVGCGLMGSGIAEVCATAGLDVLVREVDEAELQHGRSRVESSLERAVRRGKLDAGASEMALGRMRFTTDLGDFRDRQVVFEAVVESEPAKVAVFSALDDIVEDDDAILASNTSSIPIMKLGMVTERPEQVVGIHFFNPVPVLQLVELVSSLLTDEAVTDRAEELATGTLGKKVIRSQDRAGFVVNALLVPYLLSAVRMLESGFAEAGGHRSRNGRRVRPPSRTSPFVGLDRPRHAEGDRRVHVRGIQRAALLSAAAPAPHGRCRIARAQERTRVLQLRRARTLSGRVAQWRWVGPGAHGRGR